MKVLGIIPARFASTRFPGKPLTVINGTSMIERVYRQAEKAASLSKILVATDDERIFNHVEDFKGNVCNTSLNHESGTDRIAEAYLNLSQKFDVVINIQGDEPFINPAEIDRLVNCFKDNSVQIATMVKRITAVDEYENAHIVKAVVKKNDDALYFSRHPIPFAKNLSSAQAILQFKIYKHIGIYAFRADALMAVTKLEQTQLEKAESLEQLRWIENNFSIRTIETTLENISVDTPDDLKKIELFLKENKERH